MRRGAALFLGVVCLGCGNVVFSPGAGSGGAASSSASGTSGSSSSSAAGGGGAGGGWTECSSPDGMAICNGPAERPQSGDLCQYCVDPDSEISYCSTDALVDDHAFSGDCWACADGHVCVQGGKWESYPSYAGECVPFSIGALFAKAGHANRVRYADFSLFTGDPLPEPESCPTIDGVTLCGGHCGGCPAATVCTGRSPLHPYGVCAPIYQDCDPEHPCDPGDGCFVWQVEPEAQPTADNYGICYPLALCQKMAAEVPGGGKCVVP